MPVFIDVSKYYFVIKYGSNLWWESYEYNFDFEIHI